MALMSSSWLARTVRNAVRRGLGGAYQNIKVDPGRFLLHLRHAYSLPIASIRDMQTVPLATVEHIAERTISGSMKAALVEGAGFGIGGFLTIAPDVGILAGIAVRMIQKLSLVYGFEYATEDE